MQNAPHPITRYTTTAIVLHWSIAILIVLALILGLTVDVFPRTWEPTVVNTHVLIGLAVLVLSIVRLVWRVTHQAPPLPERIPRLIRRAATGMHHVLYALMILVPLIGVPTAFYRGVGIDLGLLQIASPFARDPALFRPITEVHELAAYALILLAAGHALAAIYHHVIDREDTLLRMMPGASR